MKAVIYARYSCSNQREESIEGQIRECQAYADRYGYIVVDTYIDRAKTGRKDTRPAFQKMVADSAKHTFDCVILWKFDRFARGRELKARYKKMLTDNNVEVLSVTEHIPDAPEGILLESVLDGLAEYYSVELAMKVDRGMKQNVLNKKCNGGTLTLGYLVDENRHYILDPVSAPAVLEAFQHYDSGYTMKEIVDEMNQKGIRSSRGSKININMMTKLLHNRRYLGEYRYKDVVVPDGLPRFVSDELFERVQERMKIVQKRSRQSTVEDEYILTTKLYCGECGRTMIGESGTSGTNGVIHRYYKCTGVKKHLGCTKKTVKKDWIEDIVIEQIMKVLYNEELLNQVADEVLKSFDKENTLLPVLYNEKKDIDNGIKNLLDAIQQGIITESTKERLVELEDKRKELKCEIAKEEAAKLVITKEHIMCWFENLKKYNIKNATHRRRLIDVFINAIYLFDDKIILVFNFKDNTKRTKKEKIQKSPLSSALNNCCAPKNSVHESGRNFLLSHYSLFTEIVFVNGI